MAIRIWVGRTAASIGEWNENANWADEDGDTDGVVPAIGDDVYFVSGSQNVQADTITPSLLLGSLNFGTQWTGSFVAVVDPVGDGVIANVDTLTAGTMSATVLDFANKVGAVALTGTFPTVTVQATSIASPALWFVTGAITDLKITGGSGTILVDAASSITGDIVMLGAKSARLEIEATATVSATDITIDSGRIICYEQVATITQYGGLVEMRNLDGTTGTYNLYEGTCKYKPTGAAVLTTLNNYGGFFDMRGCPSPSHTITNTTMYAGAFLDERNGLLNTIYQNPIQMNGGIMKCDLGRTVSVV